MFRGLETILFTIGILLILSCLLFGCSFLREGLEAKVPYNTGGELTQYCTGQTDENACQNAYHCAWKNGQCMPEYDKICSGYTEPNTCADRDFCKWDETGKKCASNFTNVCPSFQNELACTTSTQCMWQNGKCVINPVDLQSDATQMTSMEYTP